jgi:isopentenyl-diphosphate Delta-isomerase
MAATTAQSLVDVLDESGRVVGEAPRDVALARGLSVRTVHIFLLDTEEALLLQLLGRGRDRHTLIWGSSVAAFPHPGELADAAAERRLYEELGLRTPLDRVGTITTIDGQSRKFVTLFEGRASSATVREPDHIERLEFWPLPRIDRALAEDPSSFTETFATVYRWWRAHDRPGLSAT